MKNHTVYNSIQALELSVYVDDQQGFIKSGFGFYDHTISTTVYDNKSAIINYLKSVTDFETMPEISNDQRERAAGIREYFRQSLVAKKLMGTLNSFEEGVMRAVGTDVCDPFGVSVIASLPNSRRVADKRDQLDDWFDSYRDKSEFIGDRGERLRFSALIRDVKFISNYGIHLVTCLDDNENIVKFFFSKEPDISGLLEGKRVTLTGKVKTHAISKFSQCKETVINYVRIQEST